MKNSKSHSLQEPGSAMRRNDAVSGKTVTRFKNARRRRVKIRRMKYTCEAKIHVGNAPSPPLETKVVESVKERRGIHHESVEISLSLAMTSEEEEDRLSKRNGVVLPYGSVSVMGRRKEMEDAVSVEIEFVANERAKCDFFAVYDGHGGAQVAEVCRERLYRVVAEEIERYYWGSSGNEMEWDWEEVMEGCFGKIDREVADIAAVRTVGSTAVVAVVAAEEVVVANCGDSRAVMGRGGEAVDLSSDHKVCLFVSWCIE